MIQSLFNSTSLPVLEKIAAFAERRHEVLAGNVANISTPDYRMRDLPVADFQKALARAAAQRQQPGNLSAGQSLSNAVPQSIDQLFPSELFRPVESTDPALTFQDGNNRSIEREMMEITKNAILQATAIELMSAQMHQLQAVISERP